MAEYLLRDKILEWIKEDAPLGDITSENIIPDNIEVKAIVKAKERGVVACVEDIAQVLESLGVTVKLFKKSGDEVRSEEVVMELKGNARKILMIERVLLNLLSYLFGIATTTKDLVEKVRKVNPKVKVAATRKVIPGLRYLVKKAVLIGGGDTHRLSLSDAVLIKDNHIAIVGDVKKAIHEAKKRASFIHKIEVEVERIDDAIKAAEAGADIIMVDNVDPSTLAEIIRTLKDKKLRDKVLIEVSGGITPENIEEYAKMGPDIISTSYITMKAKPIDLSLDIVEVVKG